MQSHNTILAVIDVQGKLASLVDDSISVQNNIIRAIKIAQCLQMPILWTEQAPEKIGPTIEPVQALLKPLLTPIIKYSFSCYPNEQFRQMLNVLPHQNVLIVGIETHVCVYQTARDLLRHGYGVYIAEDAVSSRTLANKATAITRLRQEGCVITSVEMAACEMLKNTNHPQFKNIMGLIKN